MPEDPAPGQPAPAEPVLSREFLARDALSDMIRRCAPGAVLLSPAQRQESLARTLAARPDTGTGAWLFCYGSLVWNPTVRADQRRVARLDGWHRAFCLATRAGRGTPDNPGLVLGLKPGGVCDGLALHVPESDLPTELELLWRREMISGAYIPQWLAVTDEFGQALGHALAFTMDPVHRYYVDWPEERVVRTLATAAGELGTSADYLFRTRDGLRTRGIADPQIESLAEQVAAMQRLIG